MGEAVRERAVGREVLEVAVVRGDVGAPAAREGERVLELRAHGEQRHRRGDRQRHGLRGVAAGAAHDGLAPGDHARDGVVVAGPDLPVMGEEPVREAGEPREGVRVVGGQRLVREVAGGEDQRSADRLEQQVVERRVGQEDAQAPVPVRDGRRQRGLTVAPPLEQDDRASRSLEEPALQRPDAAQRPGGGDVPDHDRERLGPAALAIPQPAHRGVVGRVAGQVVAAEALDRDHGPVEQARHRGRQRVIALCDGRRRAGGPPGEPRAAGGACHGLGVEPAVGRVAVLGIAGVAQRERAHRRLGPVVGELVDDRGARPAVGAVGERVAVAPVRRVEQLAQAVVAGGDVGREQAVGRRGGHALVDRERDGQVRWPRPGASGATVTRSTRARGGASVRRRRAKASSAATGPAASTSTRPAALRTRPASPSSVARRHTNGRKPTPWTTPSTRIVRATEGSMVAGTRPPGGTGAAMPIASTRRSTPLPCRTARIVRPVGRSPRGRVEGHAAGGDEVRRTGEPGASGSSVGAAVGSGSGRGRFRRSAPAARRSSGFGVGVGIGAAASAGRRRAGRGRVGRRRAVGSAVGVGVGRRRCRASASARSAFGVGVGRRRRGRGRVGRPLRTGTTSTQRRYHSEGPRDAATEPGSRPTANASRYGLSVSRYAWNR